MKSKSNKSGKLEGAQQEPLNVQVYRIEGDLVELLFSPSQIDLRVGETLTMGERGGLLGYCPGTSAGALGEGRWDAIWGILGMLVGAALYAEAFPFMKKTVFNWGDLGKVTLPELLGVSPWVIIPVFSVAALGLFTWFEKRGL